MASKEAEPKPQDGIGRDKGVGRHAEHPKEERYGMLESIVSNGAALLPENRRERPSGGGSMTADLLDGFRPMDRPGRTRAMRGRYQRMVDGFYASGTPCIGRCYDDMADAKKVYSGLAHAARKSGHPVKACKAGAYVYLVRTEDSDG